MEIEVFLKEANKINAPKNVSLKRYKHNVQFYPMEFPDSVNYEDLRKLAIFRLALHRLTREINDNDPRRCCQTLVERLKEIGLKSFARLFDGSHVVDKADEEIRHARWRDHVSYVAARLAISQKRRALFMATAAEHKLFLWRVEALSIASIKACMEIYDIQYPTVDDDEKGRLKRQLQTVEGVSEDVEKTTFYKVPYQDAMQTMDGHRAFLKAGVAYLTQTLMRYPLYHCFRRYWKRQVASLELTPRTGVDQRLTELVEFVGKTYDLMEKREMPDTVNIKDLDELAEKSYPPCIRRIHDGLRKEHHLKNVGRVQYTLFLKELGVDVNSAQQFFREEFTQKMDEAAFEKEYAYYVRHLYGQEGSKIQYRLNDCSQFASKPVANEDYKNCAFVMQDIENLGQMLHRWKLPDKNKRRICELAKARKCGDACAAFFEATHGQFPYKSIINPLDFYRQSREIYDREFDDKRMEGDDDMGDD